MVNNIFKFNIPRLKSWANIKKVENQLRYLGLSVLKFVSTYFVPQTRKRAKYFI